MKKLTKDIILSFTAFCIAVFSIMGCTNTLADESMVEPSDWSEGVVATAGWVMAGIGTSQTVSSDALHLAYSEDGLSWNALNSNVKVFSPTIGSGHIRDPYIFRTNNGSFVLLAADFTSAGQYTDLGSHYDLSYWKHPSQSIYVAFSDDLITWTNEHLLQVTDDYGSDGAVRHAWSPRAIYNKNDRCYDIYWVGDDEDGINHVFVTETYDFLSVHDLNEHVLYNPGYSVTGAYMVNDGSKHYLFTRDADIDFATGEGGDIQAAYIDSYRDGGFSLLASTYITRTDQNEPVYTETPCVYQLDDGTWIMLATESNNAGTYDCFSTTNLSDSGSWTKDGDVTIFANGSSYATMAATVTRITADELAALKAATF
jgi:hypothetical protein